MKNVIWIVLAVVVIGGSYMLFTGKSVDEVVEEVRGGVGIDNPAPLDEATSAAGEAAEAVEEAATEAADAATETATEAAQTAQETVTEGVAAARDAASGAVEAVTEAASEATSAASDTVEAAQEAAGAAVNEATQTATEPAGESLPATAEQPAGQGTAEIPESLTVDGFDFDQARALIEAAGLGQVQESMIVESLRAAQNDPDLLRSALETARQALGL